MAFRRRFKKRRFTRKSSRFVKKFGAPRRTGGFFSVRKRMFIQEKKSIDTTINANPSTTATITLVNGCATGTDFTERIGRKIRIKSIQLRMMTLGGIASANVRYALVMDRQANGVAPQYADIFNGAGVPEFNNLNNRNRFVILFDKLFSMDPDSNNAITIKKYMKKIIDVTYGGTAATIGSIQTNSIFFVAISNIAADLPAMTGRCRIRFVDA